MVLLNLPSNTLSNFATLIDMQLVDGNVVTLWRDGLKEKEVLLRYSIPPFAVTCVESRKVNSTSRKRDGNLHIAIVQDNSDTYTSSPYSWSNLNTNRFNGRLQKLDPNYDCFVNKNDDILPWGISSTNLLNTLKRFGTIEDELESDIHVILYPIPCS